MIYFLNTQDYFLEPIPKIKKRMIQPIGPLNNKIITKIIFKRRIISA